MLPSSSATTASANTVHASNRSDNIEVSIGHEDHIAANPSAEIDVEAQEQGTMREGRARRFLKAALVPLAAAAGRTALVNTSGTVLGMSKALDVAEKLVDTMPDHSAGASNALRYQSQQAQQSLDRLGNATATHIEGAYGVADTFRKTQTDLLRGALNLAIRRVTIDRKKPIQTVLKCAAATKAGHLVSALEFGEKGINAGIDKLNDASGFLNNVCEDTTDLVTTLFWRAEDIAQTIINDLHFKITDGIDTFINEVKSIYEQVFDWGDELFGKFKDAVDSFIGRGCQVINSVNNNQVGDLFIREDGLIQWCRENDYLNRRLLEGDGESFPLELTDPKAMLSFVESFKTLVELKQQVDARRLQSSGIQNSDTFNQNANNELGEIIADANELEIDLNNIAGQMEDRAKDTRSIARNAVANKTVADNAIISYLSSEESVLDNLLFPNATDRRALKSDIAKIKSLNLEPAQQDQLIRVVRSAHYQESGKLDQDNRELFSLCSIPSIPYIDTTALRDKISVYTDPTAIQNTIDGLYNSTLGQLVDDAIPEEPTKLADSAAIRAQIESKKPDIASLGDAFASKIEPTEKNGRQYLKGIVSAIKKGFNIGKFAVPAVAGGLDAAKLMPLGGNTVLDTLVPFLNKRLPESIVPGHFPADRLAGSSFNVGSYTLDAIKSGLSTAFSEDKWPLYAIMAIDWILTQGPAALDSQALKSEAKDLDQQVAQKLQTFSQDMEQLIKDEHSKLDLQSDAIDSVNDKAAEVYSLFRQAFDFVNDTPGLKQIYDFMLGACDFDDISELLDLDVDPDKFKEMSQQFQDIYNNQIPQASSDAEQIALFTQALELLGNAESSLKNTSTDYSSVFKVLAVAIGLGTLLRIGARHTPKHKLQQLRMLEEMPVRRTQRDRVARAEVAHMIRSHEGDTAEPVTTQLRDAMDSIVRAHMPRGR